MNLENKIKNYVLIGTSVFIINGCALIKGAFDATEFIIDKGVFPVLEETTDPVYNTIEKVPPIKGWTEPYSPPPQPCREWVITSYDMKIFNSYSDCIDFLYDDLKKSLESDRCVCIDEFYRYKK